MRHRFGEFFSGPGGMSLGASLATASLAGRDLTLESRWAVDLDANACRTYHRNVHRGRGELVSAKGDEAPSIPGGRQARDDAPLVVNANVRSVDPRRLDDIEAFLFGFPCNDFSSVGERKGLNGSFGELYRDGLRVIREKKPLWFMAENVSGLLLANERTAFRQIVEHLTHPEEGLEYRLVPHLYRFEEYGIPQTRHRVIIVGVRKDVYDGGVRFLPPAPNGRVTTAREALAGIPANAPNHGEKTLSATVRARLANIPPGKNVWDVMDSLPPELRLNVKGARISTIYKVLDPDKPAYTVISSGGGGTYMYHWEGRALTDRERAAPGQTPSLHWAPRSRRPLRRTGRTCRLQNTQSHAWSPVMRRRARQALTNHAADGGTRGHGHMDECAL